MFQLWQWFQLAFSNHLCHKMKSWSWNECICADYPPSPSQPSNLPFISIRNQCIHHPIWRSDHHMVSNLMAAFTTAAAGAVTAAGAGCARASTHCLEEWVVRRKIGLKFFVWWWLNLVLLRRVNVVPLSIRVEMITSMLNHCQQIEMLTLMVLVMLSGW